MSAGLNTGGRYLAYPALLGLVAVGDGGGLPCKRGFGLSGTKGVWEWGSCSHGLFRRLSPAISSSEQYQDCA